MKKRIWTVVAAVLTLSLLGGCGGGQNASEQKVDEILWYYPGDAQSGMPEVIAEINRRLEPEIGVRLNLKNIDKSSYAEKMNLVVSSGEEFDICFTANWSLPFLSNVSNGAFIPLDKLIEENAPGLKTAMPDYVWNSTTVDGQIYAVPNYQILPTQYCLLSSSELMQKHHFDTSKITDLKSLEPFLKEIKETEPDLYPYQPQYSAVEMNYEQIYPTSFAVIPKDAPKGAVKVQNWFELPEFKEHAALMYDWYQKGYIRKDVVGAKSDTASLLGLRYAFFWGTMKPGGDVENLQKYKKEITSIPTCDPYTQTSATARTLSAISRTSKHPEKAIKVLELFNTDKELYNMLVFGIENKHYTKISENQIQLTADSNYKMEAWMFGNQFNAYYKEGQETDTWEQTIALNDSAKLSPLWGFNFNPEQVKNEISQCEAVVKEYEFVKMGAENPDAHYDAMLAKLKTAGCEKVIAEIQRQIDEWQAKQ